MNPSVGTDKLLPQLAQTVDRLLRSVEAINANRRARLRELAQLTSEALARHGCAKLVFICTHNSRRSHIAQAWAQSAAHYFGINNIKCFSGGTEATAFHPLAVEALVNAGFSTSARSSGSEGVVLLQFSETAEPLKMYSKRYDSPDNPVGNFIAIMTCSDADDACPVVANAEARVALHYIDPRESDGTAEAPSVYRESVDTIGREMLLMMKYVSEKIRQI